MGLEIKKEARVLLEQCALQTAAGAPGLLLVSGVTHRAPAQRRALPPRPAAGVGLGLLKQGPQYALGFAAYEMAKQWLDL